MSACEKQCLFGLPQCWLYIWDARSLKIREGSQLGNPPTLQDLESLRSISSMIGWRPCGVLRRPELGLVGHCALCREGGEVSSPSTPPHDITLHPSALNWWPSYLCICSYRRSFQICWPEGCPVHVLCLRGAFVFDGYNRIAEMRYFIKKEGCLSEKRGLFSS